MRIAGTYPSHRPLVVFEGIAADMRAVLAASLLGNFILAHGAKRCGRLPGYLDVEDLERITAVLEKQPRRRNITSSDLDREKECRYRFLIFERFDRTPWSPGWRGIRWIYRADGRHEMRGRW